MDNKVFGYAVMGGVTDLVTFEVASYTDNGNLYVHLLCGNDDEQGKRDEYCAGNHVD